MKVTGVNVKILILKVAKAVVTAKLARASARGLACACFVALLSLSASETFGTVPRVERRNVRGLGLSPVGFQVNFRRRERVQPFAQVSGGFLYFRKRVPDERGAHFNFTADFGGGVEWKTAA